MTSYVLYNGDLVTREERDRREAAKPSKRYELPDKPKRGHWVVRDGKLVDAATAPPRKRADGPMIMGDIGPYKSMHDGSYIGGRRQHREHLKEHGLIEYGNEMPKPMGGEAKVAPAGPDIKRAFDMIEAGYRPERVDTYDGDR